ncbi:unnamed protein product, partial [Allacma fusca]
SFSEEIFKGHGYFQKDNYVSINEMEFGRTLQICLKSNIGSLLRD